MSHLWHRSEFVMKEFFFLVLVSIATAFSSCPLTRRPVTTCWKSGTDHLRTRCLWLSSVGLCSLRGSTPRWTLSPFSSRLTSTSASLDLPYSSLVSVFQNSKSLIPYFGLNHNKSVNINIFHDRTDELWAISYDFNSHRYPVVQR